MNHKSIDQSNKVDRLRALRHEFGADWAKIGAALGRSAASVKDRCRLMKVSARLCDCKCN